MKKRNKISNKKSRKYFRKGNKINRKNIGPRPMRGGTRL